VLAVAYCLFVVVGAQWSANTHTPSPSSKSHHEELAHDYPGGFAIYRIPKAGGPLIQEFVPDGIHIGGKADLVANIEGDTITFIMHDLQIELGSNAIGEMKERRVTLRREAGFVSDSTKVGNFRLRIEVLQATDPVKIALGFVNEK
jgi:hypothetical protein